MTFLHPLVLINISDQITRGVLEPVTGVLLGRYIGSELEICDSFEMELAPGGGDGFNWDFLNVRAEEFKQVFPTYECVGWYAIGSELTKEHQQRHQQFNVHLGLGQSSSLVFLLFDGDRNASLSGSGLPLRLYETSSGSVSSSTSGLKETPIAIKTDEPERIGIDTAVKSQSFSASGSNQSSMMPHLLSHVNALHMLHGRVTLLSSFVAAMGRGELEPDIHLMRQIKALCSRLDCLYSPDVLEGIAKDRNDTQLSLYLSSVIGSLHLLTETLDKVHGTAGATGMSRTSKSLGSKTRMRM